MSVEYVVHESEHRKMFQVVRRDTEDRTRGIVGNVVAETTVQTYAETIAEVLTSETQTQTQPWENVLRELVEAVEDEGSWVFSDQPDYDEGAESARKHKALKAARDLLSTGEAS